MFTNFTVHEHVTLPNLHSASISQRSPNHSTIRSRSLTVLRHLLLKSLAPTDVHAEFVAKYHLRVVPTTYVDPQTEHLRTNQYDVTLRTAA